MKKYIAAAGVLALSMGMARVQAQNQPDTGVSPDKVASVKAIVISVKDDVQYERYFNGGGRGLVYDDQSLTKSIGSLLVGIAIDQGLISGLDEKLTHWFPELKKDSDRRKQDITLRMVMNQASGLWHENLESPTGIGDYLALPNAGEYTLHAPLAATPGTTFHYNNAGTHVLSLILTKCTGTDVFSFAKKNLFDPLGIRVREWTKMKGGDYDLSGLENVRLRT